MQKLKPHFKTFLNKKWRFSVSIFLGSFLLVMLAFIAKQTIPVSPIVVNGDNVTINTDVNIGYNTAYDGKNLTVTNNAVVTMDGEHSFNNVTLKDASTLTHTAVSQDGGQSVNPNYWTARWDGYLHVPTRSQSVRIIANNGGRIVLKNLQGTTICSKEDWSLTKSFVTLDCNPSGITLNAGVYQLELTLIEGADDKAALALYFQSNELVPENWLYLTANKSEGTCISELDSNQILKGTQGLCAHYYENIGQSALSSLGTSSDKNSILFNKNKNTVTKIESAKQLWSTVNINGWNSPFPVLMKDSPFQVKQGGLKLTISESLEMLNSSKIDVSGKGYVGGFNAPFDTWFGNINYKENFGNYKNGAGVGGGIHNIQEDHRVGAGGGGYGGCGGAGNDDNNVTQPKPAICLLQELEMRNNLKGLSNSTKENPTNFGSGGGWALQTAGYNDTDAIGGNGGGLVSILAKNVILEAQAQILAIGQNGQSADGTGGGGGSGGSINIQVKDSFSNTTFGQNKRPNVNGGTPPSEGGTGENGTIYTNITGLNENILGSNLSVRGGDGGSDRGGSGGGGRIAIVKVLDDPIVSINKEIIDGENRLATSSDKDGVMIKFKINFVTNNVQGPVEIKDQWTNLLSDVKLGITSEGVTAQINQSNNTITATYTGTGAPDQIGFIEFSGKIKTDNTANCGQLINKPPSITYTHNGASVTTSGVGITIFCNIVTGDIYGGSVSVNKDKLQIDKSSVVTSAGTIGYNGDLDKTFESTKITTWTTFTEDLKAQINDALKNTAIESSVNSDIWFLNAGGTLSSSGGKINNKNGLWKAQENSIGSQEKSFSGSGTIINKEEVNTVNITKSITKNNNSQLGLVFPENTTTINITPSDTQTLDTSILAPWAEVKIIVGAGKKLFFTGVIIANKITVEIQGSGDNMGILYMQYDPAISANPLPLFANALKYTQFEAIR